MMEKKQYLPSPSRRTTKDEIYKAQKKIINYEDKIK
jgi:hypothetical protein